MGDRILYCLRVGLEHMRPIEVLLVVTNINVFV